TIRHKAASSDFDNPLVRAVDDRQQVTFSVPCWADLVQPRKSKHQIGHVVWDVYLHDMERVVAKESLPPGVGVRDSLGKPFPLQGPRYRSKAVDDADVGQFLGADRPK